MLAITTPDGVIAEVAARVRPVPATLVVHCSGALTLDALAPHVRRASLHPLVPLPSAELGADRLVGAWFAVAGDPTVDDVVDALARPAVPRRRGAPRPLPRRRRDRLEPPGRVCVAQVQRLGAQAGGTARGLPRPGPRCARQRRAASARPPPSPGRSSGATGRPCASHLEALDDRTGRPTRRWPHQVARLVPATRRRRDDVAGCGPARPARGRQRGGRPVGRRARRRRGRPAGRRADEGRARPGRHPVGPGRRGRRARRRPRLHRPPPGRHARRRGRALRRRRGAGPRRRGTRAGHRADRHGRPLRPRPGGPAAAGPRGRPLDGARRPRRRRGDRRRDRAGAGRRGARRPQRRSGSAGSASS